MPGSWSDAGTLEKSQLAEWKLVNWIFGRRLCMKENKVSQELKLLLMEQKSDKFDLSLV